MEYVLDCEHQDLPLLEVRPLGLVLVPSVEGVSLYLEENERFLNFNRIINNKYISNHG